jgi:hypothetical protein
MKNYYSIIHALGVACACLILISCETGQPGGATAPASAAAAPGNAARVLVYRVANFGWNLAVVVSVDGKNVARLTEGQNYDGYLSAGQHTIIARVDPNQTGARPGRATLTVKAGQTYSYTVNWSGGDLALAGGQ